MFYINMSYGVDDDLQLSLAIIKINILFFLHGMFLYDNTTL